MLANIQDVALAAAATAKTLLRFDDIVSEPNGTAIPAGYGGLQWENVSVIASKAVEQLYGISGYSTGRVSGRQVAFTNAFNTNFATGTLSSGSAANFTLNSVYLTSAWRDGLTVTIHGFDDGVERYTRTVTISDDQSTQFRLNIRHVDTITFESTGGVDSDPLHDGPHVVIDNLRVSTQAGSISGTVYNDHNGNGRRNSADGVFANRLVFIDENHNGHLDPGERRTHTAADGSYSFANVPFGEYDLSFVPGSSRTATTQEIDHFRYTFSPGPATLLYDIASTIVTPRDANGNIDLDDGVYQMNLTTPIELWGRSYSTLYVSVNGLIEFDGVSPQNFKNTALPNDDLGPVIAPFWTDLTLQRGGNILVAQDPDTHKVAVTWVGVENLYSSTPNTFQVVINPDGEIDFYYGALGAIPTNDNNGVTIGVQGYSEDGASTYTMGSSLPSTVSEIVFTPHLEQTYGVAHVVVDAGADVKRVDFGARAIPPSAFVLGDADAGVGHLLPQTSPTSHLAVDLVCLI